MPQIILTQNDHEKNVHAGLQSMLANTRLKYLIIGGRNISTHIFYKCIKCFQRQPIIVEQ